MSYVIWRWQWCWYWRWFNTWSWMTLLLCIFALISSCTWGILIIMMIYWCFGDTNSLTVMVRVLTNIAIIECVKDFDHDEKDDDDGHDEKDDDDNVLPFPAPSPPHCWPLLRAFGQSGEKDHQHLFSISRTCHIVTIHCMQNVHPIRPILKLSK